MQLFYIEWEPKLFGFGHVVKKMEKNLYDDFTVRIKNNRHFPGSCPIQKEVHQAGCSSSVVVPMRGHEKNYWNA